MRRVRVIHAVRPLLSGTALGSFLFLLALYGIGREVWVSHVIANMPALADVAAVTRFFVAAFLNTRFIVQVLTVLGGAALVYTLADFLRTVRLTPRFS
ncbi:MAG: hypothetical protein JWO84_59 [Parcubacteria group bacterium]|nr:hypothetical protein [Parcubacteria group bacterium]